jgi:hypothetical protein
MAGISALTLAGLLIGLTGTALAADNRDAYFGHPNGTADNTLDVSTVTAGNVFTVDVQANSRVNQSLTHSVVGIGSQATARPTDQTTDPSLPADYTVLDASADVGTCAVTGDGKGASCDIGTLIKNNPVDVRFIVRAGAAGSPHIWASLRVAENNPDRGDNNNSFFADANFVVGATTSDANSTFKLSNQKLELSTKGLGGVNNDKMTTSINVPDGFGGVMSIVEFNNPTNCPNTTCIGQEVQLNVRDGEDIAPYVEWRLEIIGIGAGSNKGGVLHTDNLGNLIDDIRFTKANMCSAKLLDDCIVSYVIDKKAVPATTTIVFRTDTNGKIRAN